jgi:hypothetical protein
VIVVDADTDEVTSSNPQGLSETTHLNLLGNINRVERVSAPGQSAHLDHQRSGLVLGHYVDLPAVDANISGDDREAMAEKDEASESLSDFTSRLSG